MTELINDLVHMSPPVALAAALWVVGTIIKRSRIENWLIPFILPLLGALTYPFIADTSKVSYEVHSPMLVNALIGVTIGWMATAADQTIWQFISRTKNPDGKTSFLAKPDETTPVPPSPPAP